MEVRYSITLHPSVIKQDLPGLDPDWRQKIRDAIRAKLTTSPTMYGLPLRNTLKGCRKLRVGDYRVIYRLQGKTVQIVTIGHRSVVYKEILRRLR
ncbi:type II toxin-antitoxin system RelE/ParE family toxin [Candidatus Kaiserbacteria bacterium]|nr:type II toxin-antitoxin system RelE/ParE family toxin [Candidatus Kaiserbacteria bacterium]